MFHKIDKIQAQINELLNLCSESELSEQEKLGELILRAQDGELSKRGVHRLERILRKDEESLRYYVDFQMLTTMLYQYFDSSRFGRALDDLNHHVTAGS